MADHKVRRQQCIVNGVEDFHDAIKVIMITSDWPTTMDVSWQPKEDIICVMSNPSVVNNQVQLAFSELHLNKAVSKASELDNVKTVTLK